ncbi:hypothetical protein HI914_01985 [Erysiphe necator]|nr:hypothetical protein HI914_01985 [Erysiphe necator]
MLRTSREIIKCNIRAVMTSRLASASNNRESFFGLNIPTPPNKIGYEQQQQAYQDKAKIPIAANNQTDQARDIKFSGLAYSPAGI